MPKLKRECSLQHCKSPFHPSSDRSALLCAFYCFLFVCLRHKYIKMCCFFYYRHQEFNVVSYPKKDFNNRRYLMAVITPDLSGAERWSRFASKWAMRKSDCNEVRTISETAHLLTCSGFCSQQTLWEILFRLAW